jgi:cell division protein FtsI/penicillin-binding protein 2
MRRTLAALAAIVLGVTTLGACDAAKQLTGPDAEDAAHDLATALSSGAFADVAFTDTTAQDVTADYRTAIQGMGDLEPTVEAGSVTESGDTATAKLSWTWPLSDQLGSDPDDGDWTYTTEVDLAKTDDDWQVDWSRAVIAPKLDDDSVLDVTSIGGSRGPILGAHGVALVTQRPVVRFGIDRTQVGAARARASARELARLVDVDPAPYAKQVEAAGDKAFVEAIVFRKDDVPLEVARGYDRIKGARAVPDDIPLAPSRGFATAILGTVGAVTAEMIEKDPDRYQVGDQAGLSGLQARYDEQLQGVDGVVVNEVAANGAEHELFRVDAAQGEPLRLTMDERLQTAAEKALSGVGPASALVAIRPSNGAILAAANGPGTDGYNVATYGRFAPGSTFKTVSSLALLRAGLTPQTVVPCTASIVVDGKRFENYDDYPSGALGNVPLSTAIANSCNTAVISQAGKVHDGDLAAAAASLGLGIDHDLGFPAYFGEVPTPKSDTEAAADLIGQGGVLASPMAMATVTASIQAGHTVVPRLVKSVDVTVPDEAKPLTAQEAAALRGLLRGVVTSGSGRGLLDVPGPPVIAKTGTAEFEKDGKTLTHAWMVAAQGDLAVAVLVDVGSSGSGTAGPILEQFLRAAR